LCLGKKKTKKPLRGFFDFLKKNCFAHALHSSIKIYLEIENLIGLGGFFNNKVDLWVLFFKRAKKGNFDGNMMGTHWEQGKKNKKSLGPPPPTNTRKKKKKWTILIGCMKFLFPKMFIANFLPGLR
jgi:hypothetical protein